MQLSLVDIRKHFGAVRANDGISLTFEPGRIYGVLGENGAGKSTLMKIIAGYQAPDSGSLIVDGQPRQFRSPQAALTAGMGMLYQDPLDFPPFTILENYLLGKPGHAILRRKQAAQELTDLATRYGFTLDVNARIDSLSLGERQQLELVRLLAGGADLLILDEPTTGISAEQKERLFDSIRTLAREEGKTLVLVSHKLDEVQELCDHAFVLRKGKLVGESPIPCDNSTLIQLMFERLPQRNPRPALTRTQAVLQAEQLSVHSHRLQVDGIDLEVHAGETIGFAGLEGSGQSLLMRAIAGLEPIRHGRLLLDDADITALHYQQRMRQGVAYMPAGRLEEGLVHDLTLTEHMVLNAPESSFFIDWDAARAATAERIARFQVVGTQASNADALSGGNQQRFLFAMLNSPLRLILLDQPTRGLDVRSTHWMWNELDRWRETGAAIIFISADLDEIVERSDRIAVFSGGRLLSVVHAGETDEDQLGHLIGGGVAAGEQRT